MPLWNRFRSSPSDNQDRERRLKRQEASIEALESGELPVEARDRLERHLQGQPWTSTLTVPDFLVSRKLQLQPLGQVMGSCVMHPAFNSQWIYGLWQNGDVPAFTRAVKVARDTAVDRLRQEAATLGAHGVVSVQITERWPEWGNGLVEFTATGTAVALSGQPAPANLFMGNVSAIDTMTLLEAGYLPMNVVFATTAYYVMTTWNAMAAESSWSNQEVPDFSRAIYEARDLVVVRMRDQAREVGADGVLGAEWTMRVEEIEVERPAVDTWGQYASGSYTDHIVHLTVLGTAIGKLPNLHAQPVVSPILNLRDNKKGAPLS